VQNLLPLVTGGGGAIVVLAVVCWAFFAGRIHSDSEFRRILQENEALKAARADDHKAVEGAASVVAVNNQLVSALVEVSTQKLGEHDRRTQRRRLQDEEGNRTSLEAEDLGS
jgi:type II secretory pathway component PulM